MSLARQPRPRVLWLGTASDDAATAQLKFFRAFSELDCQPTVLLFFPYDMKCDYRQAVLGADLVYVGGGVVVLYGQEAWAGAVRSCKGAPVLWRREPGDAAPLPAQADPLPILSDDTPRHR